MSRHLVAASIAVVLTTSTGAHQSQQTPPVFRTGTDRVRVDVTVTSNGRTVTGLKAGDFEIKDNGAVVTEVELLPTTGAIAAAVAIETVTPWGREEQANTIEAIIDALEPRDAAWMVTFGEELALPVGPSRNKLALRRAISTMPRGTGASVWDALFASVAVVSGQPGGRALVLLLASGREPAAGTGFLEERRTLEVLRRSDVAVIALRPPSFPFGFIGLENAVKMTGGEITQTRKGDEGRKLLVDILNQFRNGYVLSYRPASASERPDGWHEIDVSLRKQRGEVKARKGYYAPGK